MSSQLQEIYPTFTSIDTQQFKKKVYDACLLFAMESYNNLKETHSEDMFPANKYYTLKDQIKEPKNVEKPAGPPRKKRNPVTKISETVSKKNTQPASKPVETETTEPPENKPEKRKTYPLILNRDAKLMIDFIINRFLWEIYYGEPCQDEECPEAKSDIERYILKSARDDFIKDFNISELIIYSVKIFNPSKIITESYGFDKELRIKFGDHITNTTFANVAAEYMNDFIKLLMLFFSNRFWFEKAQTVNGKIFETILRYIELSIPAECQTISKGLINEMNEYTKLTVPDKAKNKSDKNTTPDNTDDSKDEQNDKEIKEKDEKSKAEKSKETKTRTKTEKAKAEKSKETKTRTKTEKVKAEKVKAEKAKAKTKAEKVKEKNNNDVQYDTDDIEDNEIYTNYDDEEENTDN